VNFFFLFLNAIAIHPGRKTGRDLKRRRKTAHVTK
jgi:hypothetical protein